MRINIRFAILLTAALLPCEVLAHCDTLRGPVVAAARLALQRGDVTPVLRWVPASSENELREAFGRTLAVRTKGDEARELADRWFFETVVRLHRSGEGMPFEGLKDDAPDDVLVRADAAVRSGAVDDLAADLSQLVAAGVRLRFNRLMEASKSVDQSVEAGRQYVAAYIDFTHYLERIHATGAEHEQHPTNSRSDRHE